MEVYRKGKERFTTGHDGRLPNHAYIHEMADKKGFLGKEVPLPRDREAFERIKAEILEATRLIDKYLEGYLPPYYTTFQEPPEEDTSVVYFMEEVLSEDQKYPPVHLVDDFLCANIKMFLETEQEEGGFMVDLDIHNLKYGTTERNPEKKLYFIDFYPVYFNQKRDSFLLGLQKVIDRYYERDLPKTMEMFEQLKQ